MAKGTKGSSRKKNIGGSQSRLGCMLVAVLIVLCFMFYVIQMMGNDASQVNQMMTSHEAELAQFRSALSDASAVVDKFRHDVTDSISHEISARNPMPATQRHGDRTADSPTVTVRTHDAPMEVPPPVAAVSTAGAPTVAGGGILSSVSLEPVVLKDIVIGMAQDTDPRNLAVFCASLREQKQDIELVLFINTPIPATHKTIARKFNAIVVPFNLPRLSMDVDGQTVGIVAALQKYHPSTTRWSLMYNWFKIGDRWKQYRRAWMIDVRDSFFQENPFSFAPSGSTETSHSPPFFYIFTGVESRSIGACGWNGGWVKDCFGPEMLQAVGRNTIICSGVSVASIDLAMLYLKFMNDLTTGVYSKPVAQYWYDYYLLYRAHVTGAPATDEAAREYAKKAPQVLLKHKFPACERNGVDQGVHNVLVHNNLIPDLDRFWQVDGPVSNMQGGQAVVKTEEGLMVVYNGRGQKMKVAHQYDRNKQLQAHLYKRYAGLVEEDEEVPPPPLIPQDYKKHRAGERQQHLGSENLVNSCEAYNLKYNSDMFKGVCDLDAVGQSPSFMDCCRQCNRVASCHSFTHAASNAMCYLKSCTDGDSRGGGFQMPTVTSGWKKQ